MSTGYLQHCHFHKGDHHRMASEAARPIEAIRVGDNGQIAVPPRYRKLHKLSKGSEVLLVQLGETLMVVPFDATLDRLSERIQDALAGRGVSAAKALKNLAQVRRRRFQRLYGKR
jgi:bifunctional DNA-binding transcriptional regulator/antitoxin component of YhaV-PrlF toxin-antitoxin module